MQEGSSCHNRLYPRQCNHKPSAQCARRDSLTLANLGSEKSLSPKKEFRFGVVVGHDPAFS
ncbi:hypothetical protein CSPX01_00797 [Colletotrichum filicis]|nr:hypothetical protein CSPX01_00797 [Colletotrichum filicis]